MTAVARRRSVPEVLQTSSMDCGPAALKAVLNGFRLPVSYEWLREACRTDVDGTSIDVIETVASDLGLDAEQMLVAPDHLFLRGLDHLPALLVQQRPGGDVHFVVAWRRIAGQVEIMDPAAGRRWISVSQLLETLHRHEQSVQAAAWRDWAAGPEFAASVRACLGAVGMTRAAADRLLDEALSDPNWFPAAALEAAARLGGLICRKAGLRGRRAGALIGQLLRETVARPGDIYNLIPRDHWSVAPDPIPRAEGQHLIVKGAVLVRFSPGAPSQAAEAGSILPAAARAPEPMPLAIAWRHFVAEGLLRPATLIAALVLAVLAVGAEALLFRVLLDIGEELALPGQRLYAGLAVVVLLGVGMAVRYPIATESLRLGRHLEVRLRAALARKLPRLGASYLHSRPISDMAERAHGLHLTRTFPGVGLHLAQLCLELGLIVAGISLIAPDSAALALLLAFASLAIPFLGRRALAETEMRVRTLSAGLGGVVLDALRGGLALRAVAGQPAIRRRHEALMQSWMRASRAQLNAGLALSALQGAAGLGLGALLVWTHLAEAAAISPGDLLLVYWTLRLPGLGDSLIAIARQHPQQRNALARAVEPLAMPETVKPTPAFPRAGVRGLAIGIANGAVAAGGRTILRDISVAIAPGEHVAIVGESGAGKSTLIGLLLGWRCLADGVLTVDGMEADASTISGLRPAVAWVDPAVRLWNRNLLENLTYAQSRPDLSRLEGALAAADLGDVVARLPEGQSSLLGEAGARLSGGEGQRVRFARALMQPGVRLALLDEPFRGLDRDRRTRLLAAARAEWRGATMLCATHDIAETLSFDRVLVLAGGGIAQDGAPRELAASEGAFAAMLADEAETRARLLRNPTWRRLHMDRQGHLTELPAKSEVRPVEKAVG